MAPEHPHIARLADRHGGRLGNLVGVDDAGMRLGRQGCQIVVTEADERQREAQPGEFADFGPQQSLVHPAFKASLLSAMI